MLTALYADEQGRFYDCPGAGAVGRIGHETVPLAPVEVIPLPPGSDIMFLPGRAAMVWRHGRAVPLGHKRLALAAVLPAGYTRTHLPAYVTSAGAPVLPLFGYAAVALRGDVLCVAAVKSDAGTTWEPRHYNTADLPQRVRAVRRELPGNRVVRHLSHCALRYRCYTAQNLFYHRWEAGLPVSPVCNANCLGCISLQPAACCQSPQQRLSFVPTVDEIAAVGVYHLTRAPQGIISFGQGCEGEPSLQAAVVAPAIRAMRRQTGRGLINMNTNAGSTANIKAVVDAGLDSMRVSLISARPAVYQAYYRAGYTVDDVAASIKYAKSRGVYVSLNLLLFPGLNDRPEEIDALCRFIGATGVDMVQLRNLNLDPELFLAAMPAARHRPLGVPALLARLRREFPRLVLGSFSHYFSRS